MRPLHPLPYPVPDPTAGPAPASPPASGRLVPDPPARVGAVLPAAPVRPGAGGSCRAERTDRTRAMPRRLRCVIGVIGGVLWWGAVYRLVAGPAEAAPWFDALVAGGWGLGLIPLHAVPAHARDSSADRARRPDPAL